MQISFITALSAIMAVAQANITKPAAGDQWVTGEKISITWDPAGFSDKVDIALVPAGATDTSVVLAQIAMGISNTGLQSWTPPPSMSGGNASVIVVDSPTSFAMASSSGGSAAKHIVVSQIFVIIFSQKPPAVTETVTVVHPTSTLTSHVTVVMNKTAIPPPLNTGTGNKTLLAPPPPAAPYANATTSASGNMASNTAPSATRPASGTGTGVPQPIFTGAAVLLKMSSVQTLAPGGMALIMALVFF